MTCCNTCFKCYTTKNFSLPYQNRKQVEKPSFTICKTSSNNNIIIYLAIIIQSIVFYLVKAFNYKSFNKFSFKSNSPQKGYCAIVSFGVISNYMKLDFIDRLLKVAIDIKKTQPDLRIMNILLL